MMRIQEIEYAYHLLSKTDQMNISENMIWFYSNTNIILF